VYVVAPTLIIADLGIGEELYTYISFLPFSRSILSSARLLLTFSFLTLGSDVQLALGLVLTPILKGLGIESPNDAVSGTLVMLPHLVRRL
jgi:hypothetical protein